MLFVLGFSIQAQTNRTVMVNINGIIQRPTNFFSINRILQFDTNGNVIYAETNALTFTNALGFGTNSVAATRTNLGIGGGITTNRTFVAYDGANYTTNTVTISNGIITGWTQ